ncbi:PBP1A family penicillin-binding protein [Candidatus Bealeia paramacronuclearis]|uniref:peptidoglycan glycosyltransferase n=1 Tax=Candidatus Bealeia paramacronuclearis TaxID=1921001 RepID=A0ABZ2C5I4_9PROT|nr:PBP1A family penicillin-binding protein [Candidatus Bealeia paramacronuclearis]
MTDKRNSGFTIDPRERAPLSGGVDDLEKKPKKKKRESSPKSEKPARPKKTKVKKERKFAFFCLKWGTIFAVWGVFFLACAVMWFGYDLPNLDQISMTPRKPSITLVSHDGTRIATYGDLHGRAVKVDELPPHVVQALMAIEDRRFYSHFGVDVLGLLRAVWVNWRVGHVVQGGSTITQQLAKNFLQSQNLYDVNDRSLRRKVQEALLAIWLEHKFTKDQILTIYLNRVYLGSGTFGIEAAAEHYFGKHARELTLYESAVIAGLLKAPSRYSPANNPQLADGRAAQVLTSMVEEGYITEGAKEAALVMASSPPEVHRGQNIRYFCDWVVDSIGDYVSADGSDLIVTTTLDLNIQNKAEEKLQKIIQEHGSVANAHQMAFLAMRPQGAIVSLIGGVNYAQSKFNRATQALRQPGSAFKMVIYLAALEKGLHPYSMVSDLPITIGKWSPGNFKYKPKGEVPLQDAFAYSANTASVRLASFVGATAIASLAKRLGIGQKLPRDLTIALGTGEVTLLDMTSAFATFAHHGQHVWPYSIVKIETPSGETLYQRKTEVGTQIIDPQIVSEMRQLMSAVIDYGTGRNANLGRPAFAKTGTTQKDRDHWFVGFTGDLVAGAWTGNDNNESLIPISGGSLSLRLWRDFMKSVYGESSSPVVPQPSEIQEDSPEGEGQDSGSSESDREGLERLLQGVWGG